MTSIRDIAKLSGVSITTVSRVLNHHPYVTEEKRIKVMAAIEQLNYIPNQLAINLSRGKNQTLAFVIAYITNPYYSKLLKGAINKASSYGYHIIVIETGYKETEERLALDMLKHRSVDGLIFTTHQMDIEEICKYQSYGPIVMMEKNELIPYVYIDQKEALSTALHYLIKRGYKKIGYTLHRENGYSALERQKAYKEIPDRFRSSAFVYIGALTVEEGMQLADEIADSKNRPDALIVTNDAVSAGLFKQLLNRGIHVPQDLAIISYENGDLSKLNELTSIDLPLEQMGARAVDRILTCNDNSKISFELIERLST